MMNNMNIKLQQNEISVAQAAKMLKVTQHAVRYHAKLGHFPNARCILGRWLIDENDVKNFVPGIPGRKSSNGEKVEIVDLNVKLQQNELSVAQAARRLKVTERDVRYHAKLGHFPNARCILGRWLIDENDVKNFVPGIPGRKTDGNGKKKS